MKRILFPLPLSILIMIISCNQPNQQVQNSAAQQAETIKPDKVEKINIAISQLASHNDPFCGMPLSQKFMEDTDMLNGKIYGFCSSECKDEYIKGLAAVKSPSLKNQK